MITQPETNGTIPEKEQTALKNVRQEILIGEQKVRQLQDALRQVTGEIRDALTTKGQVEEAIVTLKRSKDEVENSIVPLQKNHTDLSVKATDLQKIVGALRAEQEKVSFETSQKKTQIDYEREAFEEDKAIHADNVAKFNEEKAAHDSRVERILKALN